jgi:class 3 adenylate cyclase
VSDILIDTGHLTKWRNMPVPDHEQHFRIDFVVEQQSFDDENRILRTTMIPDPRRYEWRELDGKSYLYDRFDKLIISEIVFRKMLEQSVGLPMYFQPQTAGDAREYVAGRRDSVKRILAGEGPSEPVFDDKSSEYLSALGEVTNEFVFMVVDIVGSTKLSERLNQTEYVRLISAVLNELSLLTTKFNGHVLKYTGDGLISYFAAPSFNSKNDLAIDCALTSRLLVTSVLNPALRERNLEPISIRIGIEAGEAAVVTLGSAETKRQKDLIGAVVNLAAKVQARAASGEIYIGEIAARSMHTGWRQHLKPVDLGRDWSFKNAEGSVHGVFKVCIEE